MHVVGVTVENKALAQKKFKQDFFSDTKSWELTLTTIQTSETISDSAECYAGLSVRFESSAACM